MLGLVAILGVAVVVETGSAAATSPGHAVTAKKLKCKKKKKRSATSAKKKCKKVHNVVLPAPAPLVRATVSWSANSEVDLHAFDSSGNHAGWNDSIPGVENHIPNAQHNGDLGPGGPSESFTDNIYVVGGPSNRGFVYVVCLYNFPSSSAYTANFTGVTAGGVTTPLTMNGPGVYRVTEPGGPTLTDEQVASTCGV